MWALLIKEQNPKKHSGNVVIHFTRFSTKQPDWDNLYSSFKVLGDGLESTGIISDDSPSTVINLTAGWGKASKRKDQRVEIEITDVK